MAKDCWSKSKSKGKGKDNRSKGKGKGSSSRNTSHSRRGSKVVTTVAKKVARRRTVARLEEKAGVVEKAILGESVP